ncbi:MAG: SGNH/GDSL hydrolase family protein [Planctomycetota bacterium]
MELQFEEGQMVIFDGDSLTNRRSAGRPDTWPFLRLMNWDKPWPDIMAEALFCWRPGLRLSFFNAASSGYSCRGLAERLEDNVLARQPDWVIASVAGNDVRIGVPTEEFRSTMTDYAERLTGQAGARVLFWGISEHADDYPKADTMPGRRAFYDILADIASGTDGVRYADIGPSLARKARLLRQQSECHTIYGDNGHFNAVGNTIIAGEMLRLFRILTPA